MGLEQLVQIACQCREILSLLPRTHKILQLLDRIDFEVSAFNNSKQNFGLSRSQNQNKSRSKSKKKIFEVFSGNKSASKNNNVLSFTKSEIIQSSHGDRFTQMQMSQSHVSQISLDNVRLNLSSKVVEQFDNQIQSKSIVNNSFNIPHNGANTSQQQLNSLKIHSNKREQLNFQIEDFFIIDFNFEKNEYEILPKRQNFGQQCAFSNEIVSDRNDQLILKKKSHSKQLVNPFQEIIDNSSISNSQLSQDSLQSFNRYSMQVQASQIRQVMDERNIIKQPQDVQELYQIRQVIMNLIIDTSPSNHLKEIKMTSSMTDLLKLTTNPSSKNKNLQHIVIPSCLQIRTAQNRTDCNKYTHIIKTHEGISYGMRYYECERFFVIIERHKNFTLVENVVQSLIKKAYELRVKTDREVDNVVYKNIRKYVEQISLVPKDKLPLLISRDIQKPTKPFFNHSQHISLNPLSQLSFYCQSAINFQFTLELSTTSTPKCFQLVLILIYFLIFEYKIILLTSKGYENILSEIINALIHMIGDLRYIYPIIMAVLTNHHIEFVHAPVPGILALWGKESRCKKALDFMKKKLKQEAEQYMSSSSQSSQTSNSLLTVVIDMNKHEFIDHQFTHKELFVIESLQNYVKSQNKQQNFFDKINHLFNQKLLKDTPNQSQPKEKWIDILKQRLRKTQMYEEYMKFQQNVKKDKKSFPK